MNVQLIVSGVVLLVLVLALQMMRYSSAFRVMVGTFTLVWSALVAMHGLPLCLPLLALLQLPKLPAGQEILIAYWSTFAIALVPAWLLIKFWLRSYSTTFPVLIDRLLHLACVGIVLVSIASLLSMSVALATGENSSEEKTPALEMLQQASAKSRRLPVETYLALSAGLSSPEAAAARRARLPKVLQDTTR